MSISQRFMNKKVVFLTTKNLDYLRNVQEINILERYTKELKIIGSAAKSYPARIGKVLLEILKTNFKIYDTVFIGFAPQLILPFFYYKFNKQDIIIDFFISMYDTFVCDRKKIKETSFLAKLLFWLDIRTLKLADMVVADTKAHGKYFVEDLQCTPDKIEVLYLKADTGIYYPTEQKKKDFSKEPFKVLYFGSILPLQGVDIVLKAIEQFKDRTDFIFHVIGPIKDQDKTISSNIFYYEWLEQKELAKKIAESDLCLAGHFSSEIEKAKRTIPGKAYIYRAMNKAMILGENPANHELFSEDENTYFVEMGNAEALARKIKDIAMADKKRLNHIKSPL